MNLLLQMEIHLLQIEMINFTLGFYQPLAAWSYGGQQGKKVCKTTGFRSSKKRFQKSTWSVVGFCD